MKLAAWIVVVTALSALPAPNAAAGVAPLVCADGETLASGAVDDSVFSRAASRRVRGEWCERYDDQGRAIRVGRYRERYASGALRLVARYVDGRLAGPVVGYHENGALFLRGQLVDGTWHGTLMLHHENGEAFWTGAFARGRLHGRVELHHPDGGLAAETRFQHGREDGAARSFHPLVFGGGVQSHVHVEADAFVGVHRVFDVHGNLIERADHAPAPEDWSDAPPVAAPATRRRTSD